MTITINCLICDSPIELSLSRVGRRKTCSTVCHFIWREKFHTTREALLLAVWSDPVTEIAYQNEVSYKAIEKRCKKLDIIKPPRGYWAKIRSGREHSQSLIEFGWKKEDIKRLGKLLEKAEASVREKK